MTTGLSGRLEALLKRVLAEIPLDARQIDFDLPRTVHPDEHAGVGKASLLEVAGREINLFSGHPKSSDVLIVEWNEPTRVLQHKRYHVPEDQSLDETAHLVYHHARRGGASGREAHRSAEESTHMSSALREIHLRLLADGTPWERARTIAEAVAKHHT